MKPLNDLMRVAMLTNEEGEVLLMHSAPIEGAMDFVEFDEVDRRFAIHYQDGQIQPITINITEDTADNLFGAEQIFFAHVKDKQIASHQKVTFVFKEM